jgi:hypothetical protein
MVVFFDEWTRIFYYDSSGTCAHLSISIRILCARIFFTSGKSAVGTIIVFVLPRVETRGYKIGRPSGAE